MATLAVAAAIGTGAALTPEALAYDAYPCGQAVSQPWSSKPVQPCPLTSPESNGWIPVYERPVARAVGAGLPTPQGWLHGTANQYFLCQQRLSSALFYHAAGWRNDWWAYTAADSGIAWGWVPQVYFKGGADDEPDRGLLGCASDKPPPGDPSPPASGGSRDDLVDAVNLRRELVDCGAGGDQARVDGVDQVVGCEQVHRALFVDALVRLRWRVLRRGVVIARAVVRRVQRGNLIVVTCSCFRGRGFRVVRVRRDRRIRIGSIEGRMIRRGQRFSFRVFPRNPQPAIASIEKRLSFEVRRYRSRTRVRTRPFRVRRRCFRLPVPDYRTPLEIDSSLCT